jgi:hypothetical protein
MSDHKGSCFCGAVELSLRGDPAAMGYCHCESCRHWSAGPINAFTLWNPAAVTITKGKDDLASYNKTDKSFRRWCKKCGGHVLTEHPGMGLTDVYAAVIQDFRFQPQLHVHYGEAMVRVRDGIQKLKDLPGDLGGTGALLAD